MRDWAPRAPKGSNGLSSPLGLSACCAPELELHLSSGLGTKQRAASHKRPELGFEIHSRRVEELRWRAFAWKGKLAY